MHNKLLYSVKQVASLLFWAYVFHHGTVLLKMASKETPKMIITDVHADKFLFG